MVPTKRDRLLVADLLLLEYLRRFGPSNKTVANQMSDLFRIPLPTMYDRLEKLKRRDLAAQSEIKVFAQEYTGKMRRPHAWELTDQGHAYLVNVKELMAHSSPPWASSLAWLDE